LNVGQRPEACLIVLVAGKPDTSRRQGQICQALYLATAAGDGVEYQPAHPAQHRQQYQACAEDGRGHAGHEAGFNVGRDKGNAQSQSQGRQGGGHGRIELHRSLLSEEVDDQPHDAPSVPIGREL
jgi:hypothetical protein